MRVTIFLFFILRAFSVLFYHRIHPYTDPVVPRRSFELEHRSSCSLNYGPPYFLPRRGPEADGRPVNDELEVHRGRDLWSIKKLRVNVESYLQHRRPDTRDPSNYVGHSPHLHLPSTFRPRWYGLCVSARRGHSGSPFFTDRLVCWLTFSFSWRYGSGTWQPPDQRTRGLRRHYTRSSRGISFSEEGVFRNPFSELEACGGRRGPNHGVWRAGALLHLGWCAPYLHGCPPTTSMSPFGEEGTKEVPSKREEKTHPH